MPENEDLELVKKAQKGDMISYGGLVRKYQKSLFNLAFRMTGKKEEAEDLVQTSFVKIYEKIKKFGPNRSFRNWAYTIVLNEIRNFLRRRKMMTFLSLDFFSSREEGRFEIADGDKSMDEKMLERELREKIKKSVLKLSGDIREAFVLFHFNNNSVADIASMTGKTENAVSIRLYRARKFIASDLPEYLAEKKLSLTDGGKNDGKRE